MKRHTRRPKPTQPAFVWRVLHAIRERELNRLAKGLERIW